MKKLIIVVIVISFAATSCISIAINKNLIRGEGEPTTELRNYDGDIMGIAASSCVDVILDSTIEPGVARVTTSPNIMEYVEVRVENSILYLGLCKDHSYHVDTLEIRISPDNLSLFTISGGASLKSDEIVDAEESVMFAISGGADIDVCGKFNELSVVASGGADVTLNGCCHTLNATVSGGADTDFSKLQSVIANVSASGGADVKVSATQEYNIQASGGADVGYELNDAKVNLSSSGGADITAVKRLI